MASKKSGPDYQRAMRSVLKEELQTLLEKLAANGEESLVLTATLGESEVSSPVYSKLGADFFYIEQENIEEMGRKFHSYCQDYANTQESSSSARKRKLSTEADVEGEGENYTEMEEVIVYVTEPDAGGSESPGKAAVSSIEASSGSAGVAVYNEALQQVTITQDDEEASSEIVIVTGNDDQSKELWTDYAAAKSSETEASSQDKEERPSQEEFRMPQSQQKLRTEVDVTGSPRLKIASRGVIGEKSGGILVRKEGLNKFTTVPVGVSPSPQRRRFLQQSAKAEPIKHEGLRSPRVKNPEASPLTRYINNMATGKSIMIRAGEDCFEEIETISIADTYSENKPEIPTTPRIMDSDSTMNDSQMSVDSQMNVHFEASAASSTIMTVAEPPEVVITETGEKVHILKNGTSVEEEQETFDIPFEDMFDLLGKSCRCLVCGKIMLKRNRRYHWRFHTGAKPYVCSYCSKKFYHPSNLKSHLFIHTARNK